SRTTESLLAWLAKPALSVEAERAFEGIVPSRNAPFNWRDGGACCSARDGYWPPPDNPSYRHCQGMGWLWLGLASGARSLESAAAGSGFRRAVLLTVAMAVGSPMAVGAALTVVGNRHTADGPYRG